MTRAAIRDLFAPMLTAAEPMPLFASIEPEAAHHCIIPVQEQRCFCSICLAADARERWGVKWQLKLL